MTNTVIQVSTAAELKTALSHATGGETILLAAGNYGTLVLSSYSGFNVNFPSTVTVASADPSNPAVFSSFGLANVSNLSVDGVVFDYTYKSGDAFYTSPFTVSASSNISITNSVFDGDVTTGVDATVDGTGIATGLMVRGSTGINISNNEFMTFYRGLVVSSTSDATIIGNDIHDMRSDGMDFASVQNVLIENNYIHDFDAAYAAGDHRDMIQFWTAGTSIATSDVIIRGNTLDAGDGAYTQSIFMRNELVDTGAAGSEMYYKNITIEDNVIYNGHLHGITVGETDGLTISDNTVLRVVDANNPSQDSSATWIPQINLAATSQNVTVTGNITAAVAGYSGQAGWDISGNTIAQDTNSQTANYYSDLFFSSSLDATADGSHHVLIDPTGAAAGQGAAVNSDIYTGTLTALYQSSQLDGNAAVHVFDASATALASGTLPKGTQYLWDFGDGTTASGLTVEHSFGAGGTYAVTLTVVLPNGTTASEAGSIAVLGSNVLSIDALGKVTASSTGLTTTLSDVGSHGLDLGAKGTALSIAAKNLDALRGSNNFDLSFNISADTKGSVGEILRVNGTLVLMINSKGELQVQMSTDSTSIAAATKGFVLNDGGSHSVALHFDNDMLSVTIDGTVAATLAASGSLKATLNSLIFGNPWGQANFDGHISDLDLGVDTTAYAQAAVRHAADLVVEATKVAPPLSPVLDHATDLVAAPVMDSTTELVAAKPVVIEGLTGKTFDMTALLDISGTLHLGSGDKEYVSLGHIASLEASNSLGFDVEFRRDADTNGNERIVWNHQTVGLSSTQDGGLIVYANTSSGMKAYTIKGLDLNDAESHKATVLVDGDQDRLQVIVDSEVVFEKSGVDYELSGGSKWGWTLGSAWNEDFHGDILDFHVGDSFTFHDTSLDHVA